MITRTCGHCGQSYQTYPSIKPRYCSRLCAGESKKRGAVATCVQCGAEYWKFASRPDSLYCSKSCVTTARNLTASNPSHHRDISGKNNPMYGRGLKGLDNPMHGKTKRSAPRWKGGRKIRKDGYIFIVAEDNHPHPSMRKESGLKYILEHRAVMEKHLGRYLQPGEVVHHIDKNPRNNNITNLQLFASQKEHIHTAHGT